MVVMFLVPPKLHENKYVFCRRLAC